MPSMSSGSPRLRHVFEWRGPISDVAFASLIYGWYGGLVYFTPILGGWIADRWLGTKATVVLGALLMAGGHLAMTFDASFLLALAAADRRVGVPEGQYLGTGRAAVSRKPRRACGRRATRSFRRASMSARCSGR